MATREEKTRVTLQQNVYLSTKTRVSFLTFHNCTNPTKKYLLYPWASNDAGWLHIAGWQFGHHLQWNLAPDLIAWGQVSFLTNMMNSRQKWTGAHSSGWSGIGAREVTEILSGRLLLLNTIFVVYCCECSTALTQLSWKVFVLPTLVLCCWCQSVLCTGTKALADPLDSSGWICN